MSAKSFKKEDVGIYIMTRCRGLCVCFAEGEDKNSLNIFSCGVLYNPDIIKKR
jgi:hypothetical protein